MLTTLAVTAPFDPDVLFRVVDLLGVLAAGLLGGAVARAHGFDPIGFLVLAICSGLGGGILRDVMLGGSVPVALTDPLYLAAAVSAAAISYLLAFDGRRWTMRLLSLADVLALGCWSATGASKAIGFGLDWLPAVFLGVVTAVGGGMLRDVLVNDVPAVLGRNPLYATLSVLASVEMVLLQRAGHYELGMAVAIGSAAVLGVLSRWRNWRLPAAVDLATTRSRRDRERGRDRDRDPGPR